MLSRLIVPAIVLFVVGNVAKRLFGRKRLPTPDLGSSRSKINNTKFLKKIDKA